MLALSKNITWRVWIFSKIVINSFDVLISHYGIYSAFPVSNIQKILAGLRNSVDGSLASTLCKYYLITCCLIGIHNL